MSEGSMEQKEIECRVVQEPEIHDFLAEVEGIVRSAPTDFIRVVIEPVSVEKHRANQKLAEAVKETDRCLGCGEPIEQGGFCGLDCLQSIDTDT